MATPFDPNAFFPPFFDAPDPSTLQWPWSQPPVAPVIDPAAAVAAPPIAPDPAAAPPLEVAPPLPLLPQEPPPFAIPPPIDTLPSMVPQPAPDALTGAAGQPPTGELGGVPYAPALTPEQSYQQAVAGSGGDPLAIQDDAQRQRALNELSPAEFAELQIKHNAAREKEIGAKRLEIANQDFDQQKANFQSRQVALEQARAKGEQLEIDAQRIADTKVDPVGGIGAVLMGIIGGLIQGKTGSATNPGIEALKGVVAQRLELHRTNMANQREGLAGRRSALAGEFARVGDDYQAAETVRLAALKHADDLLAAEQLNYDPQGTTALRIAATRRGIAAEQAAARQAYEQKAFENGIKLQDAARQQQIADEARRHNRASEGLQFAQIKSAADDRKLAREQRLEDKATERADKEAERVRQFTLSSPRPMLAVDDKGAPVVGPDGKPVVAAQRFTNADGKPWELGSPERTAAMEAKIVTASELSDIIDEVKDIRENTGKGVLPWSAARQRLTVLEERATTIAKQGTQGMSSDNDFKTLRKSVGADDFKSFMNISATLDEARERTQSALNTAMRTANYTGPAVTFANKYGQKAQETVEEIRLEKLLTDPGRDETELRKVAAAQERARTDPSEEAWSAYRAATESAFEATPYQRDAIAQLGVAALGPANDPEATKARQKLAKVAEGGPTSTLRRLAKAALDSTALRDASSGAQPPDRAVSYETAPPGGR